MMNKKGSRLISKKAIISLLAIFMIAISLVFTVYAEDTIDEGNPHEAVVKGTVYDADTKMPIWKALVTIEYHETLQKAYTDSNGQYLFKGIPECFCLKNMTASKAGYMTQELWVSVGDTTEVDFFLNPLKDSQDPEEPDEPEEPEEPKEPEEPPKHDDGKYGTIKGKVVDAKTYLPISSALMILEYHDVIRSENTDSDGLYTFAQVPICFCLKNISALKNGYDNEYELVGVSEITYVNFSLVPVGTPEEPEEPEDPEEPKQYNGVVTGVVIDATTDSPIEDVVIVLEYHDTIQSTFTDFGGEYLIENVPECNCSKDISAAKEGYEFQNIQISVHGVTWLNFSFLPMSEPTDPEDPYEPYDPEEPDGAFEGVIQGMVIDAATNLPMDEVLMTLTYHEDMHMLYSDSDGFFEFTNVPICFCLKNVSSFKDGYVTEFQLTSVSEDTYVTFSLETGDSNLIIPSPDVIKSKTDDKESKSDEYNYKSVLALVSIILIIVVVIGIIIYGIKRKNEIV
jgi:hypothetical protein